MAATLQDCIKHINDNAARERKAAAWFYKHFPEIPEKCEEYSERADASAWFSHFNGV